jgi:hypothetical protein
MKKIFSIFFILVAAAVFFNFSYFTNTGNDKDINTNNIDISNANVLFNQGLDIVPVLREEFTLAVLFNQGELISHPGQGLNGDDVSAITTGGTLYGFGAQANLFNWMGDDFTVPPGQQWRIDSIRFFSYQTGSSTTSTITASHVAIWNGRVDSAGVTLNSGDTVTNRMARTYYSRIYRTTGTPPFNTQTTRPIMCVTDTINVILNPGYYWLQVGFRGTLSSGPWAPPRTILNQLETGNSKQKLAGVWGPGLDGTTPQGLPFIIYGDNLVAINNNNTGIPSAYSLKQNYPNPFNPVTKISFDMPKAGNVKITVYNINGKEVDILVNQNVEAGSYSIDFDASKLASGIYFYTLTAGSYKETKKMMLVK